MPSLLEPQPPPSTTSPLLYRIHVASQLLMDHKYGLPDPFFPLQMISNTSKFLEEQHAFSSVSVYAVDILTRYTYHILL